MNIAEILKHKPQGTKLYSPICGAVTFDKIERDLGYYTIFVTTPAQTHYTFMEDGKYERNGECLLFPSNKMRDWSKFAWERGDALKGNADEFCIFDKFTDDSYTCFDAKYMRYNTADGAVITSDVIEESVKDWYEKVSPKEANEYIKEVEESFRGKFNSETLSIEFTMCAMPTKSNEPKFKPFDKVVVRIGGIWYADIFSHKCSNEGYQCIGGCYDKILPYNEETAKLIGTANNYKNV